MRVLVFLVNYVILVVELMITISDLLLLLLLLLSQVIYMWHVARRARELHLIVHV